MPEDTIAPKRLSRRTFLLGGGAGFALLAGGGATWGLDRYVVDHVDISDAASDEATQDVDAVDTSGATGTFTDTSYSSQYCTIDISTVVTGSGDSTVTYYVADVVLTDATVLRSAFANDEFGTNIVEDTSAIAADHAAVFAINGDYYGFRDTGIV